MEKTILERIKCYWEQRSDDFSRQSFAEMQNEKYDLWSKELKQIIGDRTALQILDVGTGSGYMALLLASSGHNVTGIDLCDNMIASAIDLRNKLKLDADFGKKDFAVPAKGRVSKHGLHGDLDCNQIEECNAIKNSLDISNHIRPLWDADLLMKTGFSKVTMDLALGSRINQAQKLKTQGMFGVYAYK